MTDKNTIARPYSEAVFELARAAGELDRWSGALQTATELLADGRIVKFLASPKLTDRERLEFISGLFAAADGKDSVLGGGDEKGANFLRILLAYDRVAVLPEIADHFETMKARVENTVDVTVTSATPLDDGQRRNLAEVLKKRLGCEVRLETELDEDLIGGAVIRAGDVVIDGSLRSRLQGLSNALIA